MFVVSSEPKFRNLYIVLQVVWIGATAEGYVSSHKLGKRTGDYFHMMAENVDGGAKLCEGELESQSHITPQDLAPLTPSPTLLLLIFVAP